MKRFLVYYRVPPSEEWEVGSVEISSISRFDLREEITEALKEKYGPVAQLLSFEDAAD